MRINKSSEAVLAKYAPQDRVRFDSFTKPEPISLKNTSLHDFYQEVYAKINTSIEQVYHGKNAQEIERMMMENRKLIEAKRS
jgi:hypothetical protein